MSTPGASSSSSSGPTRPEAEPLPRKVAEFGYVHDEPLAATDANSSATDLELAPHPAERTVPATPSRVNHNTTPSASSSTASLPMSVDSTNKSRKAYHSFLNFLRGKSSKPMPLILGIELPTVVRLLFTVIILVGVIVAWAITVTMVSHHNNGKSSSSNGGDNSSQPDGSSQILGASQNVIFIHTGFGIVTLIACVLLERAVFMARAERYAFTHPNSGTRRGRGRGQRGGVALAPWNRPPLPTYANAMGFRGTGDVEDAQIAAPPPPEYGNTRGSTLLLSAFLGSGSSSALYDSEGDPRGRPISYASRASVNIARPERAMSRMSAGGLSVRSMDSVEENARRARRLEESLASLEGSEEAQRPPASLRPVRR